MERLGAHAVNIPPFEIADSLREGKIDAAEFSLPSSDEDLGIQKTARYAYFPGWQQSYAAFSLLINQTVWDTLGDRDRIVIEMACETLTQDTIEKAEATQGAVLRRFIDSGIQVRRWPPRVLVAFEDAWLEVAEEQSAANPDFERIYEAYLAFRSEYDRWRQISDLR